MVRQAMTLAASAGASRLAVAVDAANFPALRLYTRHGFRTLASRLALIGDLREHAARSA
jgi:ribosomal protein S18 acetylase RimI-like enzyme